MRQYYILSKVDWPLYFRMHGKEYAIGSRQKIGPFSDNEFGGKELDKLVKIGYLFIISEDISTSMQPVSQPSSDSGQ